MSQQKGYKTLVGIEDKQMPRDFWNYLINPITGFPYTIRRVNDSKPKYIKTKEEEK